MNKLANAVMQRDAIKYANKKKMNKAKKWRYCGKCLWNAISNIKTNEQNKCDESVLSEHTFHGQSAVFVVLSLSLTCLSFFLVSQPAWRLYWQCRDECRWYWDQVWKWRLGLFGVCVWKGMVEEEENKQKKKKKTEKEKKIER